MTFYGAGRASLWEHPFEQPPFEVEVGEEVSPWYLGPWPDYDPSIPAIASCIAAYQPKWPGGIYTRTDTASYANSKINLANPGTYDCYEGIAIPWTQNGGWATDKSAYLLTGITGIPNDHSWSTVCEFRHDADTGFYFVIAGCRPDATNKGFGWQSNATGASVPWWRSGGFKVYPFPYPDKGNFCISGNLAYHDAALVGSITVDGVDPFAGEYSIGAIDNGSQPSEGTYYALAIYDVALTADQVGALDWAMDIIRTA